MSDKHSKDGSSSLDAKLFELMLKEAAERYYEENEENPPEYNPDLIPPEDMKYFADRKDIIYKKILRQAKTGGRKTKHTARKYILIAAVIGIIAALTVSASAVKEYLREVTVSISGDTLTMNATRMASENYSDIKNFKYMDDVIVPTKLPSGLMLNEIVDSDGVSLTLVYTYADNSNEYIRLEANYIPGVSRGGGLLIKDNEYSISDVEVLGMSGKLVEVVNQLGRTYHEVELCSDNFEYIIISNVSKDQLNYFIANLVYLKDLK